MNRNDFFDIEDQIRNALDNAYGYMDDKINYHVGGVLNEVKNHLNRGEDFLNNTINNIENTKYKNFDKVQNFNNRPSNNVISPYIVKKPVGRVKGIIYSIFGISSSVFWGITLFSSTLMTVLGEDITSSVGFAVMITSAAFFAGSMYFAFKGSNIRNRIKRFKKYAERLNKTNYCKIEYLAESVVKNNKFVINDLYKMMDLDMFKHGHFDDESKYFMLGDDVYEAYLDAQKSYKARVEEENANDGTELGSVIKMGQKYVREIREANDSLPGEVISEKLYKLEDIVNSIFKSIEKNPSKLSSVKKFVDHYLPMTLKLVNSYKELDTQAIQGENIKKAKAEIEKSIDLVNSAFEKLLDDLFQDMAMDISSDISVLKTLFTQEGLAEDDFKKDK